MTFPCYDEKKLCRKTWRKNYRKDLVLAMNISISELDGFDARLGRRQYKSSAQKYRKG